MSFDQVDYLCAMLLRKLLVPLALLILCGCEESSLFQKVVFMPNQSWGYSNPTSFAFTISDTASRYRVFFVLRHTDAYEYNNIWINMASQLPGDSIWRKDRFNIPLANEKGWLGTGMDDLFDHRVLLYPQPVSFRKPGNYKLEIRQDMRVDPLQHVMNVGLRLEKVK